MIVVQQIKFSGFCTNSIINESFQKLTEYATQECLLVNLAEAILDFDYKDTLSWQCSWREKLSASSAKRIAFVAQSPKNVVLSVLVSLQLNESGMFSQVFHEYAIAAEWLNKFAVKRPQLSKL